MTNTTSSARPIDVSDLDFDDLTEFESTLVRGSALKPGMLLVDPVLGTPVYFLDHRLPALRNTAGGRWLVLDLEQRKYTEATLLPRNLFPAATRLAPTATY